MKTRVIFFVIAWFALFISIFIVSMSVHSRIGLAMTFIGGVGICVMVLAISLYQLKRAKHKRRMQMIIQRPPVDDAPEDA